MEDLDIIELYWARSEEAILATDEKYGHLLRKIIRSILRDMRDAEECLNDSYLGAWNSMPPQRPRLLRSFLCRIARNTALDRADYNAAACRRASCSQALEELEKLATHQDSLEEEVILAQLINDFLADLTLENRVIFLRRYWFFDSIRDIAQQLQCSESRVTSSLHRSRNRLRTYLEGEGISQ